MAMESQAEALNQLTTDDLEGKVKMTYINASKIISMFNANAVWLLQFALLESSSVDDDLAKLKRELSASSPVMSLLNYIVMRNLLDKFYT